MRKYIVSLVLMVMIAVMAVIALNRQWFNDWWKGMHYQPEGEMGRIMEDLELTSRGEFLFRASLPQLSSRNEFNLKCRSVMDEEIAVLGCYTNDTIYIYNIESKELDGIRELTTAHELLHAVWARMSENEKRELEVVLTQVYDKNQTVLEKELATYDASLRQEELFVRAGTEIANLPTELEKVYGEIFQDQDTVVKFYDKYIGVFREMEAEMEELSLQMETLQNEIDDLTVEYEQRLRQLATEVDDFNNCANTMGCFSLENDFYARRAVLVGEQGELEAMYNQINGLVEQYNGLVEQYNADVTQTQQLNQMMNSASRPEKL